MRWIPNARRVKVWLAVLAGLAVCVLLGYGLWSPGIEVTDGRHDTGTNGVWMSHRWLGDDAWFETNQRQHLRDRYRDPDYIGTTLSDLAERGIIDLFPHLAPTDPRGALPGVDDAQLERLLDAAQDNQQRVLPWVGGVFELHCHPANPRWRERFIASVLELLERHPRLAGIHLNIEPWPSGNAGCLDLLDELNAALPAGAVLSVAAYPPPTRWQPTPEVHWDEAYFRRVARRCDQLAVMMYDTAIPLGKPYTALMARWTREVLAWSEGTPVLLGLPCYDDAETDYHDPAVENLGHALRGIHAGLKDAGTPEHYRGVALYSLWEMDVTEWDAFDRGYRKAGPK